MWLPLSVAWVHQSDVHQSSLHRAHQYSEGAHRAPIKATQAPSRTPLVCMGAMHAPVACGHQDWRTPIWAARACRTRPSRLCACLLCMPIEAARASVACAPVAPAHHGCMSTIARAAIRLCAPIRFAHAHKVCACP